jgi:hypothetical protein
MTINFAVKIKKNFWIKDKGKKKTDYLTAVKANKNLSIQQIVLHFQKGLIFVIQNLWILVVCDMRVYIHVYVEVYDCILYKYYETMLNGPNLNLFIKR